MRFFSIRLNAHWSRLALLAITASGCASAASAPASRPASAARPTPNVPRVRLAPVTALVSASPSSVGMDSTLTAKLDSIVRVGIAEGASPGAALAVGRYGRLVHLRGYGTL